MSDYVIQLEAPDLGCRARGHPEDRYLGGRIDPDVPYFLRPHQNWQHVYLQGLSIAFQFDRHAWFPGIGATTPERDKLIDIAEVFDGSSIDRKDVIAGSYVCPVCRALD